MESTAYRTPFETTRTRRPSETSSVRAGQRGRNERPGRGIRGGGRRGDRLGQFGNGGQFLLEGGFDALLDGGLGRQVRITLQQFGAGSQRVERFRRFDGGGHRRQCRVEGLLLDDCAASLIGCHANSFEHGDGRLLGIRVTFEQQLGFRRPVERLFVAGGFRSFCGAERDLFCELADRWLQFGELRRVAVQFDEVLELLQPPLPAWGCAADFLQDSGLAGTDQRIRNQSVSRVAFDELVKRLNSLCELTIPECGHAAVIESVGGFAPHQKPDGRRGQQQHEGASAEPQHER